MGHLSLHNDMRVNNLTPHKDVHSNRHVDNQSKNWTPTADRHSFQHADVGRTGTATTLSKSCTRSRQYLAVTVLLVHTDQDAEHLGPGDDRREHSKNSTVTSKTSHEPRHNRSGDERGQDFAA